MQTAFFLTDEFEGNLLSHSIYDASAASGNRPANVSDPRPKIAWVSGKANPVHQADAVFEVDSGNKYLDVTGPSGPVSLTIDSGRMIGDVLADRITAAFAAEGTYAIWSCSYNLTVGKFTLKSGGGGSPDLQILWKTGTHGSDNADDSLAAELGFLNPGTELADSSTSDFHGAPYGRWNTTTSVIFRLPEGKDLRAFMCEIVTNNTGDPLTQIDDSPITIYGSAGNLGPSLYYWEVNASDSATFSPAPSLEDNQIRVAKFASGAASTSATFWRFSWRHQDSHKTHTIKLAKAFERTQSATGRTIGTLTGQGLDDPSKPLGTANYYPVAKLKRWVVPLTFDAWPASEYVDVIQAVVQHGRQVGLMWALRWDDIADDSVDAEDEADRGFLIWAALTDYSRDKYVGEGADYISGELDLEQIR